MKNRNIGYKGVINDLRNIINTCPICKMKKKNIIIKKKEKFNLIIFKKRKERFIVDLTIF